MSYSQRAKDRAHAADPEAFASYSGKPRKVKQLLDARRTAALREAAEHFGEPLDGRELTDEEARDVQTVLDIAYGREP